MLLKYKKRKILEKIEKSKENQLKGKQNEVTGIQK